MTPLEVEVDTFQVVTEGYPLSSRGKNFKIKNVSLPQSTCCRYAIPCICIHENQCYSRIMSMLLIFLFPILPVVVLFAMCYYSSKPEIQMASIKIAQCPNCKSGIVKSSAIVDGDCSDIFDCCSFSKQEYFYICEKCLTVYQGKLPIYLMRVDRELESSG